MVFVAFAHLPIELSFNFLIKVNFNLNSNINVFFTTNVLHAYGRRAEQQRNDLGGR